MPSDQKVFWIINQYSTTPNEGMGGRHYYLSKELAKQGHKVYLIAASFSHLQRDTPNVVKAIEVKEISQNFHFVWVKVPKYSKANSKKRILNWFLFTIKLRKLLNVLPEKPSSILFSSPSLVPFLGAQWLAKKTQSKLVFEVRDIWPLTLVKIGGYSVNHPFIKIMQWIEDKAYRESDLVISNLPNAVEHMVARGMDASKFSWIPNGFDVDEIEQSLPLPKDILELIPKDRFVVGYVGTIGVANCLDTFIESAGMLQKNENILFVLVGDGGEKSFLRTLASSLNNVVFIDAIEKSQVQIMLKLFDVCYLGWRKNNLYRFGTAANKLPEYMFSSKPIIHGYEGFLDFVKKANCGVVITPESSKELVEAILDLERNGSIARKKMGMNGKAYALKNHDYRVLAKKMAKVLV